MGEDEEEDRWQAIETAPKDETAVLLWQAGHAPYIGHFDLDQWWTDEADFNDGNRQFPPLCQPTHWMPLPDPPTDAGTRSSVSAEDWRKLYSPFPPTGFIVPEDGGKAGS